VYSSFSFALVETFKYFMSFVEFAVDGLLKFILSCVLRRQCHLLAYARNTKFSLAANRCQRRLKKLYPAGEIGCRVA
jgi:hypothetical protein